jgi:hypothetical protein
VVQSASLNLTQSLNASLSQMGMFFRVWMTPIASTEHMMTKFARVYVVVLFVLELLLIAASLLLHISMWIGKPRVYPHSGQTVLLGAFLSFFPAAIFPNDRNIWRTEFKNCPQWVRGVVMTCVLYGITIAFLQMVFLPVMHDPDGLFLLSAIMLVIGSISLCVLYSVVWRNTFQDAELVKRSGISFVVAVACIAMFAADRLGYFQRPIR